MGIWKIAGKEWNRQDGKSIKEKKKKEKRKGNSEESMREKRWGRRKWDPTNKYHDYGAKLLIVFIENQGRLDFLSWEWEGLKRRNDERENETNGESEKICVWVVFVYNHWIAYMLCVSHPI